MGKIRLLPDEVASQVAAGEVVERPASVVKELVENSVDAGARRITVEFARGGAQMIRVADDGCGMDREDALLSLERHATSKIRSAEDLARVTTMGFRGEAVPSIASVSRFRLVTRSPGAEAGTEITVAGGKIESVSDSGEAPGTTVEVRALFFNLPARRKFLRSEETEAAHIVHQMESLAIAHPDVAMTLVRDGRRLWQAAATTDPGVRLRDLFGPDFLRRLVPLAPREENGITISGHLARPGEGRPDREQQFVVLNGRVVQCPAVYQPLREAYSEAIPRGRHPLAVLRISMDPMAFDCNVHPAKREIRLHRPDQLRQAVFLAARAMLDNLRRPVLAPEASPAPAATRTPAACAAPAAPTDRAPCEPRERIPAVAPAAPEAFRAPPQGEWPMEHEEEKFEIIGGLADRWILMRSLEGLVLLDARGASERILFESLKRETASGDAPCQRLLLPEVIELPPKDFAWISENLEALRSAGFLLEPFGGSTLKVEALPACLAANDARAALLDLCASLRASGSLEGRPLALDALIRSVSSLAAVKKFSFEPGRARQLVSELLRCDLPYASPRGHPTMIQWSFSELDRKFGG
ncbi:MAG: DNA mismatch repair endonuclease MutL [Verrucomicrobiae bacterium]